MSLNHCSQNFLRTFNINFRAWLVRAEVKVISELTQPGQQIFYRFCKFLWKYTVWMIVQRQGQTQREVVKHLVLSTCACTSSTLLVDGLRVELLPEWKLIIILRGILICLISDLSLKLDSHPEVLLKFSHRYQLMVELQDFHSIYIAAFSKKLLWSTAIRVDC